MKNRAFAPSYFSLAVLGVFLMSSSHTNGAESHEAVVGDIRVQALSPTLVRIEQKGSEGFENRETLTVRNRNWPGIPLVAEQKDGETLLKTSACQIRIPKNAADLKGITLHAPSGELLHTISPDDLKVDFLPSPGKMPGVWVLPDFPRIVPPKWGATPAPASNDSHRETSGWIIDNKARDIYFFLPQPRKYADFRREFLSLTGPTPMPPLFAFGLWFSRYWPYSEEQSLALMDEFRTRGFPLDLFVCDTDWRVGAATGYGVNEKLFPDMARFIAKAHEKNVRVMYNDHPEPRVPGALDPEELAYREKGLASLLDMGADVWWYDKNWGKHLNAPNGLTIEFWGMVLYHDMTLGNHPGRRPLIMSNVDGIWGGMRLTPSNPAAHRYPIWWTGDTLAFWEELRSGIDNGVTSGIDRMMPYINEDLGGHMLQATPELYTRWFQYGVLSPLPRPHSYPRTVQYPWAYGKEAEDICREYALLRYRLMPMIYTAVRQVYDTGTPLLQRCDLHWPDHPEAADGLQYLFGEDILVAPQCFSGLDPIPTTILKTPEGTPGLRAEYFDNAHLEGRPKLVQTDARLFFDWKKRPQGLPMDHVSVRWTGTLGPMEKTAEYEFGLTSKDGSRFWLGDKELISKTEVLENRQQIKMTKARVQLEAGKSYPIRVEFSQEDNGECNLFMGLADKIDDAAHQTRSVWIPPGRWQDAWTGETWEGPQTLSVTSDLAHTPMYVREGAMVTTTLPRMSSGIPVWDNLVVDAFLPRENGTSQREIYEDDGLSNDYLDKKFSRSRLSMTTENGTVSLQIAPAEGAFPAKDFKRNWTLRLHLPEGRIPTDLRVNGEALQLDAALKNESSVSLLKPSTERVFPFGGKGALPGNKSGDIVEFSIPHHPADQPLGVLLSWKDSE